MAAPEPSGYRAWQVEVNGINPVGEHERRSAVRDVFWVWFAANLAITSVVIGAVVRSYGLSLIQSLLALGGLFSFIVVGYFGLPGMRTGKPTMALSEVSFGRWGNVLPSILSWINLVGWETVVLVTAAYALQAALHAAFGIGSSAATLVVSLAVVTGVAFTVAFLGHATIVRIQTVFSYLFGALTLLSLAFLLPRVPWHALLAAPGGPWLTGVVPAWSLVVAVSGLSWVNTASDYTRYLPRDTVPGRVVWATTWGSVIPSVFLMGFGVLLASAMPSLASTANPVGLLDKALPPWMSIPYLLTAAGGMITGDILDVYSSGLGLLAARVPLPRSRTVVVDGVLSVAGSLYFLLVAKNFVGTFEAFLTLLAGALAPWAAIFLLDSRRYLRQGYPDTVTYGVRWSALLAWGVGILVSTLFASVGVYNGPLAVGVFQGSSLGFLLGFFVTLALYPALARLLDRP